MKKNIVLKHFFYKTNKKIYFYLVFYSNVLDSSTNNYLKKINLDSFLKNYQINFYEIGFLKRE